jgi:hypothetical protein
VPGDAPVTIAIEPVNVTPLDVLVHVPPDVPCVSVVMPPHVIAVVPMIGPVVIVLMVIAFLDVAVPHEVVMV